MTRVNADLCPAVLTDQHLLAEYREMRRIPRSLLKSLAGKSVAAVIGQIPADFRLGAGHLKFFYDKGYFLIGRHALLRRELLKRAYRLNDDGVFDNLGVYRQHPAFLGPDNYAFSSQARAVIVERIMETTRHRPDLYTLNRAPIVLDHYFALLQSALASGA